MCDKNHVMQQPELSINESGEFTLTTRIGSATLKEGTVTGVKNELFEEWGFDKEEVDHLFAKFYA